MRSGLESPPRLQPKAALHLPHPHASIEGPRRFIQLVSHAPHIPHHARALTIDKHPDPRWITDGAVLFPAILAKFINLERLAIHVGTRNAFQWTESPAAFKDALREAVTSKVTTLRLHRVWFSRGSELAALLARPSSVTSLNLSTVFIDSEVDSAGDDAVVPLVHLRLRDLTENLERCLTQSKFISAHLRHLHISLDNLELETFRELMEANIQSLGANLEHLHLEYTGTSTGTRQITISPPTSHLTALRTLELTFLLPSKYLAAISTASNVQYQDWVLHMFRSPTFASPNLRLIVMNIRIPTHNEADMLFISSLHELDERIIALDVVPDVLVRLHSRANLRLLRVERQEQTTNHKRPSAEDAGVDENGGQCLNLTSARVRFNSDRYHRRYGYRDLTQRLDSDLVLTTISVALQPVPSLNLPPGASIYTSMSMAEPEPEMPLPQELVDLILDFVGDSQSLKSCALASSLLRGSSQKRLFASLTLMPQSKKRRRFTAEPFIELLSPHATHILRYVRVLTIKENPQPSGITDAVTLFPAVLPNLVNLERLVIDLQWTELPGSFKNALREATTSKVTALRLHNVHFTSSELAALLSRPSSVTSLGLSRVFISEVDSAGGVVPLTHLRLSHLTENLERWLTQSEFISAHLRHLHISFLDDIELEIFHELMETNIQSLGANLEHLHLECTGTHQIAISPPTCQPLTALRTLELTLLLPSKYLASVTPDINVQYQDWVLHMFRSPSFASASPNLQRIVMNIRIPTHNEADMFFISNLHELDERIIALDVVPDVVVRLHSKLDFHGRWRANLRLRAERQVKDTFPFSYQRGMLWIELL
ncbi:hypothetical protein C8F01DRAFT_1232273 [Mycena amicta]|nr:hypothetical protein C8F01DRAFT_1232273 [Mycena amicta]